MSTPPPLAPAGLDQSAVRRMNTAVVLRALADAGADATLQQLKATTGLSRRTLEVILDALVTAGWAQASAQVSGGGAGRPAKSFRFVPDHRVAAALRIDTHFVHAMIVDLAGTVLGRASEPLGDDYGAPERALDRLADALESARRASGIARDALAAGTLAAGGVIDAAEGTVVRLVNAPRWSGFPIARQLSERVGFACSVDNDANLAALAEHAVGGFSGNLAWLTHGQRSGAGFVIGGAVHRGRAGSAGELIESATLGLPRDAQPGLAMLTSPVATERESAMRLAARVRGGDSSALREAEVFVAELARIVDLLTWTIAPDVIVLGGGLETAADVIDPLLRAHLRAAGTPSARIAASALGADAMLLGAARDAIATVEQTLFASIVETPAAPVNGDLP